MDHFVRQPVDVFIKQITYLPFTDVISICSSNQRLRNYCMNYDNHWKSLIDNTFGEIYDYQNKLEEIRQRLGTKGYNYLVYTHLIKILDHVTQLMIYYKQKDMKSFDDQRFTTEERAAALFLLNEPQELETYGPVGDIYIRILINQADGNDYNRVLVKMAQYGNMRGILRMLEYGADINSDDGAPLYQAASYDHFEVVKYLVENGASLNDELNPIEAAAANGNLKMIEYLVTHGARPDDYALTTAIANNQLHLLPYFESKGIVINDRIANLSFALAAWRGHLYVLMFLLNYQIEEDTFKQASATNSLDVFKFLSSKANIISVYSLDTHTNADQVKILEFLLQNYNWSDLLLNQALISASSKGNNKGVELLLDAGADIHHNDDLALKIATRLNHPETVNLLLKRSANPNK